MTALSNHLGGGHAGHGGFKSAAAKPNRLKPVAGAPRDGRAANRLEPVSPVSGGIHPAVFIPRCARRDESRPDPGDIHPAAMTALAHLDGGSGEIHPAPTTTLAHLDGGSSPASLYTGINKDNQ